MSGRSKTAKLAPSLLLVLSLAIPAPAGAWTESPSGIMSRAMIEMMDSLGDLAQAYKGRTNWSYGNRYSPNYSWSGIAGQPRYGYGTSGAYDQNPFYTPPLQSPLPGTGNIPPLISPLPGDVPPQSPVDGIWIGRNGEIVLVMYGHFRIYASAETYRDGRFRISEDRLSMLDPASGRSMEFEYLLDDGRMILRNEWGDILLFKQLPIPIPPYSLIGNAPPPTDQRTDPLPIQEQSEIPESPAKDD
jgi:hypothetical protein